MRARVEISQLIRKIEFTEAVKRRLIEPATLERVREIFRPALLGAPLRVAASTTITPSDSPLMMRFRRGKTCCCGGVPGTTLCKPCRRTPSAAAKALTTINGTQM